VSEHVFIESNTGQLGGRIGVIKGKKGVGLGVEVGAVLTEVKVGGKGKVLGADVKGSVGLAFGIGGGIGIGAGEIDVKFKVILSFEFQIDFSGPESLPPPIITLEGITEEPIAVKVRMTAKDELSVPPRQKPAPPKKSHARPKEKPYVYSCQYGPASNAGKAYPGFR